MSEAGPRPREPGRFPLLLLVGVLSALLVLGAAAVQSWQELAAQRAEERELGRRIEETEARIEELRERIDRLQNDPATLEREARQQLGLVRPGEIVVVVPEDEEPAPRPAPDGGPG